MRAHLTTFRNFLNLLGFLISPLAALMFVIGVIVVADRFNMRQQFLQELATTGQTAWAVVANGEVSSVGVLVNFDDAQGRARHGFIDPHPYPATVQATLHAGAEVQVVYLPAAYETDVALAAHLDSLWQDWGYLQEGLVLLALSWMWVVVYPDFLYLGYVENFGTLRQRRPQP